MRTIIAFLLLFSATALATSTDLQRLPDIGHSGDYQSQKEIQRIQESLIQRFAGAEFEQSTNRLSPMQADIVTKNYAYVDPNNEIPRNLLNNALIAYDENGHLFDNKDYLTVMDFSKRSNKQRIWVVNMNSGSVWALRTTHGAGGDTDHDGYVEQVSNISGSHMSSKGFYKVAEVYYGKWGRSVRMDGLSSSNSRARPRAIVIHGADYVKEKNIIQGRSWGCFVFAWSVKDDVIDLISGGSLMYADFSGER